MHQGLHGGAVALALHQLIAQCPHAVQEAVAARNGRGLPRGSLLKVAHEHLVQTHGVGTVLIHHLVGVDDVAKALGHLHDGMARHLAVLLFQCLLGGLLAAVLLEQLLLLLSGQVDEAVGVQAKDHAVGSTLLVGLCRGHHTDIVQELMPEAAVQQVQGGVLHAAVIPIHGAPVLQGLLAGDSIVVVGIAVTQEIPAGTGPLGHSVGLALGGGTAAGAGGVDPLGVAGQRAFAVLARLKVLDLGQTQGQLALKMCIRDRENTVD